MIRSVEIENIRGIHRGRLDGFTPLTILVGVNSSGKSALLESLYIAASPNIGEALNLVMNRRNLATGKGRWLIWKQEALAEINLTTDRDHSRNVRFKRISAGQDEASPYRIFVGEGATARTQPKSIGSLLPDRLKLTSDNYLPFEGVTQIKLIEFGSGTHLHDLFSMAIRQSYAKEIVDAVCAIVPDVVDIVVLTEANQPSLYLTFKDGHSVPISLAGDGVQSLLRFLLELTTQPDGVVLLEEPEVHQHPGAIRQSAKAIWTAVQRNIQVILTTHSLELIDALLNEAVTTEQVDKMSVYSLLLRDGCLRHSRLPGENVVFARGVIEDDLR